MIVAKTSQSKVNDNRNVITMKVTLRGMRPPVWRRLAIPGTMTLRDLHQAIQAVMGWEDCHLHLFEIRGKDYGDRYSVDDVYDENSVTLNSVLKSSKRFTYVYDFGDHWEHTIIIEKNEPAAADLSYPVCITGKRQCPPEDCGGVWRYQNLLAAVADPDHPERKELLEWLDEDFDPAHFDLENTNSMLAYYFRRE